MVSQHMHLSQKIHLEVVYKILRYLKGSPRKGLLFKRVKVEREVFTNADWIGLIEDRRFITGYCTFVWENVVT